MAKAVTFDDRDVGMNPAAADRLFPGADKTSRTHQWNLRELISAPRLGYTDSNGSEVCEPCAWVLAYNRQLVRVTLMPHARPVKCSRCGISTAGAEP